MPAWEQEQCDWTADSEYEVMARKVSMSITRTGSFASYLYDMPWHEPRLTANQAPNFEFTDINFTHITLHCNDCTVIPRFEYG